jgi:UDPglucose 6-dehydrogenase
MAPAIRQGGGSRQVAVIGAGHVGLPTAAALVTLGHKVACADTDSERVATLQSGRAPIFEHQLDEAIAQGLACGRLSFLADSAAAVRDAEFAFLCVPTPEHRDGSADLSFLRQAAEEIGPALRSGAVVINKSTVPIGATREVEQTIGRDDIYVVSNPEFMREGTAVHDSLHPDRIVVGADDQRIAARVGALFASTGAPLLVTDAPTAETIKYVANAFLATKLSFINAVAGLCDAVGADVRDVILGLGYDPRIGFDFLRPGPGWGGSCFPKDTKALLHIAEDANFDFPILRATVETNDAQTGRVLDKLEAALTSGSSTGAQLEDAVIAAWGLTFKADTDDLRESPALKVVGQLLSRGARVQAYDPTVHPEAAAGRSEPARGLRQALEAAGVTSDQLPRFSICMDATSACAGAAAVMVLTEWDQFRQVDLVRVRDALVSPIMIDTRNVLDPAAVRQLGFQYTGVGRR